MSGPRLALTFPGQDARHPGMGRLWAGSPSWFLAERASEVSGHDVAGLLLDPDEDRPPRTDRAQIATFVLEMVILAELRRVLPAAARPLVCAGHGPGEYAALVAARIIGFDEGVRLVSARGEVMREASAAEPGTAAAVHSPSPAAAAFSAALAGTAFRGGSSPVVANADARPHRDPGDWPGLLEHQLTGPVRWADSVRSMADDLYCDMFVEIGPGRTLTALARRTAPRVSRLTISEPGQLPAVPRTLVRSAA